MRTLATYSELHFWIPGADVGYVMAVLNRWSDEVRTASADSVGGRGSARLRGVSAESQLHGGGDRNKRHSEWLVQAFDVR